MLTCVPGGANPMKYKVGNQIKGKNKKCLTRCTSLNETGQS